MRAGTTSVKTYHKVFRISACIVPECNKINAALTMSTLFLPCLPLLTVPLFQSTLAALTLSILAFRDICLLLNLYTSTYSTLLQPPSHLHKYTSTSSTASTGTHLLPAPHPLQVYILCKSTSSTSPHLCPFRPQAMRSYAKQLQILKSNFTREN